MKYQIIVRFLKLALVLQSVCIAQSALASVYLTLSASLSDSNAGFIKNESKGGSASIAVDLSRYIRLGYTHRQELQESKGWMGAQEGDCQAGKAETLGDLCLDYESRTHVIANSIDLTLILYDGDVVVPYISGGFINKVYDIQTYREDKGYAHTRQSVPGPNLGAGLAIKINRSFQLKLNYNTSPGPVYTPDGKESTKWDGYTSIGLSYQL